MTDQQFLKRAKRFSEMPQWRIEMKCAHERMIIDITRHIHARTGIPYTNLHKVAKKIGYNNLLGKSKEELESQLTATD